MSQLYTNEFHNTTNRIFLLFVAFIQWFQFVLGFRKKKSVQPLPSFSPTELYIKKQTQRFLHTFREDELNNNCNYNSNIDAIIKDTTALSELMKMQDNEIEKKWRSNVLIENTPRGNIIMFYDAYKHGFSYYCDNSVMPYDIMNAVAMKYVLTFFCRDFFVDSSVLPILTASSPSNENKTQTDTDTTNPNKVNIPSNDTAFVKFKSYNTATKKNGVSTKKEKTINCFLHLGASRNWSPISKKARPNPINGFKTNMVSSTTVRTQTKVADSDSRQVVTTSEKKTLSDAKGIETLKDIGNTREDLDLNVKNVHVTKEKNKMSYLDYKKMHKLD